MRKMQILRSHLSANGLRWTYCFLLHGFLKRVLKLIGIRLKKLEMKYKLPGDNTLFRNYTAWQNWNWEKKGEEWTVTEEWKRVLINDVLLKNIEAGKTILEIGPGAGRWTETLQKIAKCLIIVDLSDKCIELCKKRFSNCSNIEFFVNDGNSLNFIKNDEVDFIWSFDVFVHINAWDTEKYITEFNRILKKGGRGIVHHPREGRLYDREVDGWRSNTSAQLFSQMLERNGLTLIKQFDSWGDRGQFDVKHFNDIITVFEKQDS
jgi:ubiquinone/menaquinone biosynthesis C-methylase UbiE